MPKGRTRFLQIAVSLPLLAACASSDAAPVDESAEVPAEVQQAHNTLSDSERDTLNEEVRGRSKRFVHALVALILISGIYNVVVKATSMTGQWHMLFGVKFLLAMVVLFFASALVGKSKSLEPMRQNPARWLSLNILLAAIIVMISGILRFLPPKL